MKKIIFLLALLLSSSTGWGQNYIHNGSFEEGNDPTQIHEIWNAVPWENGDLGPTTRITGTSDLFRDITPNLPIIDIPIVSGKGEFPIFYKSTTIKDSSMAHVLFTNTINNGVENVAWREYIIQKFANGGQGGMELCYGVTYRLSFWALNVAFKNPIQGVGMYVGKYSEITRPYKTSNTDFDYFIRKNGIIVQPQLVTGMISNDFDTTEVNYGWVKFEFDWVAQGGEDFIAIGYFQEEMLNNQLYNNSPEINSEIYIDHVSIESITNTYFCDCNFIRNNITIEKDTTSGIDECCLIIKADELLNGDFLFDKFKIVNSNGVVVYPTSGPKLDASLLLGDGLKLCLDDGNFQINKRYSILIYDRNDSASWCCDIEYINCTYPKFYFDCTDLCCDYFDIAFADNDDCLFDPVEINNSEGTNCSNDSIVSVKYTDINGITVSWPLQLSAGDTVLIKYEITLSNGVVCNKEKYISCDENCCDFYRIQFVPEIDNNGNCCWTPVIIVNDSIRAIICDTNDINLSTDVTFFADGTQVYLDANGQICLPPNNTEVQLTYIINNDGEDCNPRTTTLFCAACDCPDKNDLYKWIDLTVEKGGSGCSPDQCKVTGTVNIPNEYLDCYDSLQVIYIIRFSDGSLADHQVNPKRPITSNSIDLTELPACIPSGSSIQYGIKLFKNGSTSYCSVVSEKAICDLVQNVEIEPCLGDSEEPWKPNDNGIVEVTIDGCQYEVSYVFRKYTKIENGKVIVMQDIQMTQVLNLTPNCSATITNKKVFLKALPKSIKQILDTRIKYKPQYGDGDSCSVFWRVLQFTCWSTWTVFDGTNTVEVVLPCESPCCARKLEVCYGTDGVTVSDKGPAYVSDPVNCSTAILDSAHIPLGGSYQGEGPLCKLDDCSTFIDIVVNDNTGRGDITINSGPKQTLFDNKEQKSQTMIMYQVLNTKSNLIINVANSIYENIDINIYDINGRLKESSNFILTGYSQTLYMDISGLQNGTYFYNIMSDGKIIGSDKFIIIR